MTDVGERVYHVDGELVPATDATVHVEDRGFAYGDAAFETLRAYGGDVFRWSDHADRLANTCRILSLDHGLAANDLKSRIDDVLTANDLQDAYVKLSITRGVQPGTLDPHPDIDPTVVVITKPLPRGGVGSQRVFDGPATLQTTKVRKVPNRAIPAAAKTHNYLNGILARLELRTTGADEAMLVDPDGYVAEGATSNLFFVDDSGLHTPSVDGPVLPGITRQSVIELAESEGIPVVEGQYTPDRVRNAREAFLTNSTWEIRPIDRIDGLSIDESPGGGPITTLLARLYDERVEDRYYGDA